MINEGKESTELRLDESNELYFTIKVFGAERSPDAIRLVCEAGDVSYAFKGKATSDSDVVCFVVPPMKDSIKAGLYEARVEVIVDDHYFVPVKFNASFKQPMKVVAEASTPVVKQESVSPKREISIQAQPMSGKPLKLSELYNLKKK